MIRHPLIAGLSVTGLITAPALSPDRLTVAGLMFLASLMLAVLLTAWVGALRKDIQHG